MLWLGFRGLLEWGVIGAAIGMGVIPVWTSVSPHMVGPSAYFIPPWGFFGLLVTLETAVPFVVGWDIANRSKGRHLAAGLAVASMFGLSTAFEVIRHGAVTYRDNTPPYPHDQNLLVNLCVSSLCAIAGALFSRLRITEPEQPKTPSLTA
jgi:hypothetical protein